MKIIEALKQTKDLQRKASDIREKIKIYCVHQNIESPTYDNQEEQVENWLQSHSDIVKEILRLRVAIQKTNVEVKVSIAIGGQSITKSIAEWIHRRRDLAALDESAWKCLTDKGLREGLMKNSQGEMVDVKIVRCYAPAERDVRIETYRSEPTMIDGQLEITNATTNLIE